MDSFLDELFLVVQHPACRTDHRNYFANETMLTLYRTYSIEHFQETTVQLEYKPTCLRYRLYDQNYKLLEVEIEANRVHFAVHYSGHTNKTTRYSYEWAQEQWQLLRPSDFMDLEAHFAGVQTVLQQALGELKQTEMDCLSSEGWMENIKNNAYVKSDGIQLIMNGKVNGVFASVPIKLSWERLRPFLKQK